MWQAVPAADLDLLKEAVDRFVQDRLSGFDQNKPPLGENGGIGRQGSSPRQRHVQRPDRTRIDAYPTVERYGLVFAFLGDLPEAQRPPIMPIPEYGPDGPREGWAATIQYFEWDIDYQRSIENGIDPAHNEYVHDTHGFSGEREESREARRAPTPRGRV